MATRKDGDGKQRLEQLLSQDPEVAEALAGLVSDLVAGEVATALSEVQSRAVETAPQAGSQAEAIAAAVASALETSQKSRLFKNSRKPFVPVPEDEIRTPENFNILQKASERAMKLGHTLRPWRKFVAENPSPLVQELPEDYITTCACCGWTARARWEPPARNDQQGLWRPVMFGSALKSRRGGKASLVEQYHDQFPGARPSAMGGRGAGFTTTSVQMPTVK